MRKLAILTILLLSGLLITAPRGSAKTINIPGNFTTIQHGITNAATGDIVMVAPGTYMENLDFKGKAITVTSSQGATVTVIDGQQIGSVVVFAGNETEDSVLDGFTLLNGTGTDMPPMTYGGGVLCIYSSPVLRNLVIDGNGPTGVGGGICCMTSSPSIVNVQVTNNQATSEEAGKGGGIACWNFSSPYITNCTIMNNSAFHDGGGIWCYGGSSPVVTNSIVWDNTAQMGTEIWVGDESNPATMTISYTDLEDTVTPPSRYVMFGSTLNLGQGVIQKDPNLFYDTRSVGRLAPTSPCLDVGYNDAPKIYVTDVEGHPRIFDGLSNFKDVVDLGSDEYLPLLVPDHYPTIQGGINAAINGDVITVSPGSYMENIDFLGKDITVRSDADGDPLTEDLSPATTVIDGMKKGPVVSFVNQESVNVYLNGFTITNGLATDGGGIFCDAKSKPRIYNCIIRNNRGVRGGGVCSQSNAKPVLENNLIIDNEAYGGIGAGGGIFCLSSPLTVISCTIYGNHSVNKGGGIFSQSSNLEVSSSIVWNNTAVPASSAHIHLYGGTSDVTYSDVQGGFSGAGNIDADPLFIAGPDGNFYLRQAPLQGQTSPCVDKGASGSTNVTGTTRTDSIRDDQLLDMGFHYPGAEGVVHKVPSQYFTIGLALNSARPGDTVLVAPGTYNEMLNFNSKDLLLRSDIDGNPATYDIAPYATVIDGKNLNTVVKLMNATGKNPIIDGFTIRNGKPTQNGGGIYCEDISPTIMNCLITANSTTGKGAGIYCESCNLRVLNCQITNNTLTGNGGSGAGIYATTNSIVTISGCTISGNTGKGSGGGLYAKSCSLRITDNFFLHNAGGTAQDRKGGGLYIQDSDYQLFNNVIAGNTCAKGGGINIYACSSLLNNNTIVGNTGLIDGGGFRCTQECTPEIFNTILWNNEAPDGPEIFLGNGLFNTSVFIDNSFVDGGLSSTSVQTNSVLTMGVNVFDIDPIFKDEANDDYHLKWISPCINRGINEMAPVNGIGHNPRPFMGTADIGAYEFVGNVSLQADKFALSASQGGSIHFTLYTGAIPGYSYFILGSVTGIAPGVTLPGGHKVVPVCFDAFTLFALDWINTPLFDNFMGFASPTGYNYATMNATDPLPPASVGLTLYFAGGLGKPWGFVTNPIAVDITP